MAKAVPKTGGEAGTCDGGTSGSGSPSAGRNSRVSNDWHQERFIRRRTGVEILLAALPDLLLGVPEVLARQLIPLKRLIVLAHRLSDLGRRLSLWRLAIRQAVAGFGRGRQEVDDGPDRQLDAVESSVDL